MKSDYLPAKKKLAMCVASLVLKQAIEWVIFENLSTTTKIES